MLWEIPFFLFMLLNIPQLNGVDALVVGEDAAVVAIALRLRAAGLGVAVLLTGTVQEAGLDAAALCKLVQGGAELLLEITESAYTEIPEQLLAVMTRLRDKGYEIEMDDFGTGYSSLNMLSTMPVDVLKMDRAFVVNIDHSERDNHLVELILKIARNLDMPVIAEGVETEGQMKMLRDAGCELIQGYYFSKPLPPDQFEKLIAE